MDISLEFAVAISMSHRLGSSPIPSFTYNEYVLWRFLAVADVLMLSCYLAARSNDVKARETYIATCLITQDSTTTPSNQHHAGLDSLVALCFASRRFPVTYEHTKIRKVLFCTPRTLAFRTDGIWLKSINAS